MTGRADPIFKVEDGMAQLLEVMRRLRNPETGCPWDIEQTFETIAPYTIEEAYEVADAIERGDIEELESELGDLLLQVVYHGAIGAEAGHFDFHSIADRIAKKMISRHPHVFGEDSREKTAEQQTRDWESAKASERSKKGASGVLDDVALGLPALLRALKLQKRAARVGFDWPNVGDVINKIREEADELAEARNDGNHANIHEEFGDLLFVITNLGRHLGVDSEAALRDANAKFTRRFRSIESALAETGRTPSDSDLTEMDQLWNDAKAQEKQAGLSNEPSPS